MKKTVKNIAWGLLFVYLNINININDGTIDLLPDFFGWFLIFREVGLLGFSNLDRSITGSLIFVSATAWVMNIFGIGNLAITLILIFASMYIEFKLLTALAIVAEREETGYEKRIIQIRNAYLILYIAMNVTSILKMAYPTVIIGIGIIILVVYCLVTVFGLANLIKE